MSLVIVTPETVAAAALDVARIGSSIGVANSAAAGSTTSVLAAGADEVSAAIATLFGSHAREYQAISTQVAAFHDRFAQTLSAAVGSYVSAEATNAAPLATLEHNVLNALNAPTQALLGRPLIGDGAAGAPGTGQAGGAGGILWGNGGAGGSGAPGQVAGPRGRLLVFLILDKPETLSHNDVRLLRTQTHPRKCQKSPKTVGIGGFRVCSHAEGAASSPSYHHRAATARHRRDWLPATG